MNEDFLKIPMMAVHPDRINIYTQVERLRPRRYLRPERTPMPKSNYHNNKISDQARRKVTKAIEWLIFMAADKKLPATSHGKSLNFKISFVTLTLSSAQIHSDNEIKAKCLNQFLIEASNKWNVKNYVWRAEKQINGNIHFHILTDKFIPWNELRQSWNRIQNKLGYVDRYRQQMLEFHKGGFKVRKDLLAKWEYKKQVKAYREGSRSDWHNPNSTDIHSLRMISNTKAYVLKYVTKDQQESEMQGRLWGCNYELTDLKGAQIVVDSGFQAEITKAFRDHKPEFYKGEYFTVVYIRPAQLLKSGAIGIIKELADYISDHFGEDWQNSLYQSIP
jgi:hypothetical protein